MFVIMNVGTELLYRKRGHYNPAEYSQRQNAKAVCTRLNKTYGDTVQWKVMTIEEFNAQDILVAVYNTITGDGKTPIYIRKSKVGGCCDPSTERYHSC